MRRPIVTALAIAIAGLLAIPASADFHRVLVTELQVEGRATPRPSSWSCAIRSTRASTR